MRKDPDFWKPFLTILFLLLVIVFGLLVMVSDTSAQELPPHLRPVDMQMVRDYDGCNCWRVGDKHGEQLRIMTLQDDIYYLTEDVLRDDGTLLPAGAYVMTGYVFYHPEWTAVFVGNGVDEHCSGAWLAPGGVAGIPYVTVDGVMVIEQ